MKVREYPFLSIVIPIHNERDNIFLLVEQIVNAFSDTQEVYELIFIDDGSTDGSDLLLDNVAEMYDVIKAFHFSRQSGQTAAFDAGFKQAKGDLIITLDGDLQYDPSDIFRLLPLTRDFDLVCGKRVKRNDTLIRALTSRFANAVRNFFTEDQVQDTGCSLKIFSRKLVLKMQLFEGMHRFFPTLAKMHGFSIAEADVQHFPRAHGQSKYGIHNRLWCGLLDLLGVWWMTKRCLRYEYRDEKAIHVKRSGND